MNKYIIIDIMMKVLLAAMCYCLGVSARTSHLRRSLRSVRKSKNPKSVQVCIDTRRSGPQTMIVQGPEEARELVFQLIGDSASLGACDPVQHRDAGPLTTKQKESVAVCLKPGEERMTTILPRVALSKFRTIGASRGRCSSPTSQIELKIVEDESVTGTNDMSVVDISGEWNVIQIRLKASLEPPLEDHPITLRFRESGFRGNAGCNSLFGKFTTESLPGLDIVVIPGIASTKMLCHPPKVMMQEQALVSRMSGTPYSYKINAENQLKFYETSVLDEDVTEGELFAVFERV